MSDIHDQQETTGSELNALNQTRGVSRMIPDGTVADHVTRDQIIAVAEAVTAFIAKYKIPQIDVAKKIGYQSASVITEFCSGRYKGSNGLISLLLQDWLIEEEQRRSKPAITQFVWTNVAKTILSTANYLIDADQSNGGHIGLIYGPETAGLGKTFALQAIAERFNHKQLRARRCSVATINKADRSTSGVLRAITDALGLPVGRTSALSVRRIIDFLKGRSHLLIIDQIQSLRGVKGDMPLYVLSDLADETKTPQLWCGTADMMSYLERMRVDSADESLAQITSRVFPQVDLMATITGPDGTGEPLISPEQVAEMFAKTSLRITTDGLQFLMLVANTPDSGCVRTCVKIVSYAIAFATLKGIKQINAAQLKQAMRSGLGMHKIRLVSASLDANGETRIRKAK